MLYWCIVYTAAIIVYIASILHPIITKSGLVTGVIQDCGQRSPAIALKCGTSAACAHTSYYKPVFVRNSI